jgi:hypothetical protein
MGNGAINCCEASSSMLDELTMVSPRNMKPSPKISLLYEASRGKTHESEFLDLTKRVSLLQNIEKAPVLQLKVVNSGPIPKDTRFVIRHQGLENSKRRLKDGKVYFGTKRKERGTVINDIVIPSQSREKSDQPRGRHFVISYHLEKASYFIRDLGQGFGVYARVDSPLVNSTQVIKDNMIISIGSSFLALSQAVLGKVPVLNVKMMDEAGASFCFEAENGENKVVSVGRGIMCEVRLEDGLLSKIHATVFYGIGGWSLVDGDMEKHSTNGTWLYVGEEMEMHTAMIFKANQSVFQVTSIQ